MAPRRHVALQTPHRFLTLASARSAKRSAATTPPPLHPRPRSAATPRTMPMATATLLRKARIPTTYRGAHTIAATNTAAPTPIAQQRGEKKMMTTMVIARTARTTSMTPSTTAPSPPLRPRGAVTYGRGAADTTSVAKTPKTIRAAAPHQRRSLRSTTTTATAAGEASCSAAMRPRRIRC